MRSAGAREGRAGRALRTTVLILTVGVTTAGCWSKTPLGRLDPFEEAENTDEFLLTVLNEEVRSADIFAYWNGLRDRVGTISARQTKTFRVRWRSEEVRIGYELIGRRALPVADYVDAYTSEAISVTQGDHLEFRIIAR